MRTRSALLPAVVIVVSALAIIAAQLQWLSPLQGLGARGLAPVQESLYTLVEPVAGYFGGLRGAEELRQENEALKQRVAQQDSEIVRLREAEKELQDLKKLQNITSNTEYQFAVARVIGRNPGNLARTIVLNKGSDAGIQKGQTVLTEGGLVGQVKSVTPTESEVLLITSGALTVPGRVQRLESRLTGIIEGELGGKGLVMKWIEHRDGIARILESDTILTSGEGQTFAPNVLVGTVKTVHSRDIDPFETAEIESLVDFKRLEQVYIITNFQPKRLS